MTGESFRGGVTGDYYTGTVSDKANNKKKLIKCCLLALYLFSDVRTVVVYICI